MWWGPGDAAPRALAGAGPAPAGMSVDALLATGHDTMPDAGPWSVTVPGSVSLWERLLEAHGRLEPTRVLGPAIDLAEQGFAVTPVIASEWAAGADRLAPGARARFLPGGRAPAAGERFANPALGGVLRRIAEGGAGGFYSGPVAEALAAAVGAAGGPLRAEDLAAFRGATWVEPIRTRFRDVEVLELPPPGQGLVALAGARDLRAARWDRRGARAGRGAQGGVRRRRGVHRRPGPRRRPGRGAARRRLSGPARRVDRCGARLDRRRGPAGRHRLRRVGGRRGRSVLVHPEPVRGVRLRYRGDGGAAAEPRQLLRARPRSTRTARRPGSGRTTRSSRRCSRATAASRAYSAWSAGSCSRRVRSRSCAGCSTAGSIRRRRSTRRDYGSATRCAWKLEDGFDPDAAAALRARGHEVGRLDAGAAGGAQLVLVREDGGFAGASERRKDGWAVAR